MGAPGKSSAGSTGWHPETSATRGGRYYLPGMTTRPPPVRDFALVNGARLHYELQGDGFPVVLLHGGLMDLRLWDGQVGLLSQHFTTLRYDPRGCGASDAPEGQPYAPYEDLRVL